MLVSAVIAVPRSLLNDPSSIYWSDTELVSYLAAFISDACGKRRDLYTIRNGALPLTAGVYQTLPAGGIQLLEVYGAGATAPVVFITDITDLKHSKFAALAAAPPVANIQAVSIDPRDRTGFRCYPPSTGSGSTVDALYSAVPDTSTLTTSSTYPLPPDSVWAAQQFVLGSAFDKNNERRDALKSQQYMQRYADWLAGNLQAQMGVAERPD